MKLRVSSLVGLGQVLDGQGGLLATCGKSFPTESYAG